MHISEIGEDNIIHKLDTFFGKNVPRGVLGIGDDCAVIPQGVGKSWLVGTDLLVEDVHFIRDKISPRDLGYKAIAVNLSDIAAMGGVPKYVFLSMALPKDIEMDWLDDFCMGMQFLLEKYDVALLGGDTTGSKGGVCINVTVIGEASPGVIKYRSGAEVGDVVCVTDNVGDSAAGLQCVLQGITGELAETLMARHYRPRTQVKEGTFLAAYPEVHAMMDISDGLQVDIQRMQKASQCGVEIFLETLPMSQELQAFAQQDPFEIAAIGGEDYSLLVAIDAPSFPEIAKAFAQQFGRPLTAIGRITQEDAGCVYLLHGQPYALRMRGFQHF